MPTPASSEATVFEMIARGEHDTKVLHETRGAIAFNDIAPYGAVHIIVAPRRPIVSCVTELKRSVEHRALVAELVTLGRKALQERCCDVGESEWVLGFEERTIFHAIPHICLHAIAPPLKWNGYFRFDPNALVPFRSAKDVAADLSVDSG
tara:strand:+ start:190 stop:639 length:450 start_codon:yes stop_codon:yes gene_type:complete